MCYSLDESNNILQMKTTFKKAKSRNKLGVNIHSCYDYKSTNYSYNNYKKPQHSSSSNNYNISPSEVKYCYICKKKGHKAFQCQNKRWKDFCQTIKTYSKGQTYFFALGYDIVLDKSNLSVDCGVTKHVITDKSKFINFDQNFKPRNHFVELVNGSQASNIMLKRGNACIYLHNSSWHIFRCILKNALYIPTFNIYKTTPN